MAAGENGTAAGSGGKVAVRVAEWRDAPEAALASVGASGAEFRVEVSILDATQRTATAAVVDGIVRWGEELVFADPGDAPARPVTVTITAAADVKVAWGSADLPLLPGGAEQELLVSLQTHGDVPAGVVAAVVSAPQQPIDGAARGGGTGVRPRSGTVAESAAPAHDDRLPVLSGGTGRALLVGVNYVGQDIELTGSHKAAWEVRDGLEREGFTGDVRLLTDDGAVDRMPTHTRVTEALEWLVDQALPGDSLICYFAGRLRGLPVGNGYALIPADHREAGVIDLKAKLRQMTLVLPRGSRLLVLIDAVPSVQMELPARVTAAPAADEELNILSAAAASPPPQRRGDTVVLSLCRPRPTSEAGTTPTNAGEEGELGRSFCAALTALRGQSETPLNEAGRVFQRRVAQRFPDVLPRLVDNGQYIADDFRAWVDKSIVDLQAELAAAGIETIRAGPLKNLATQVFRDLPDSDLAAPPPLRVLLCAMRDSLAAAEQTRGAAWPTAESATAIDPDIPFLPSGNGWIASGKQPEAAASPSRWRPVEQLQQQQQQQQQLQPQQWHGFDSRADDTVALLHAISSSPSPQRVFPDVPRPFGDSLPAEPQPEAAFTAGIGYISTGGDIMGSPRLLTIREAEVIASKYPQCKGFSFRGEDPRPSGRQWVYFKDKWDIHGRGWTSYRKAGVGGEPAAMLRPPLQQQQQQQQLGRKRRVDPGLRQRLVSFFQHYNPSKLPSVTATLAEYEGFEDALFDALVQKYGPEPPDTMAEALPSGWRLVESPSGDLFYKHVDGRKQWERPRHPLPPEAVVRPRGLGATFDDL